MLRAQTEAPPDFKGAPLNRRRLWSPQRSLLRNHGSLRRHRGRRGLERRRRCGAPIGEHRAASFAARGRPGFPARGDDPAALHVQRRTSLARRAGIPEFDWDFVNTDGAGTLGGRSLRLPRGRLVGGTSMINATIAARGAPFDFDRWAAMGNKGWAWADLLPLVHRHRERSSISATSRSMAAMGRSSSSATSRRAGRPSTAPCTRPVSSSACARRPTSTR